MQFCQPFFSNLLHGFIDRFGSIFLHTSSNECADYSNLVPEVEDCIPVRDEICAWFGSWCFVPWIIRHSEIFIFEIDHDAPNEYNYKVKADCHHEDIEVFFIVCFEKREENNGVENQEPVHDWQWLLVVIKHNHAEHYDVKQSRGLDISHQFGEM